MARAPLARSIDPGRALLSIGQVLARLTPEFPELTPSKLRFLEEQQLIAPARTESGYRKFSQEDIERIRLILSLQRDQYLPLRVIRNYLSQLDAGLEPELPGTNTAPTPTIFPSERRYSRAELLREAGADSLLLQEAQAASLLAAAEPFGEDALVMLRALAELQRAGIEPRHLRGYRQAAERELGLIEGVLQPLLRRQDAASRAKAAELAREIGGQLDLVRSSLSRAALLKFNQKLH